MTQSPADNLPSAEQGAEWVGREVSGQRAMLVEILARVSMEALQGDTLDDVLQRIVDCVAGSLPVAIASIILLDETTTCFTQEVWAGTIALDLPSDLPWPVTLGVSGRCVRSGEAQLITDVDADPDYVSGNPNVKSEYLVPIRHRTRMHGILNLESTQVDFFTPELRAMFDAVALQIAGAVHLARLAEDLEQANRRLEQLSMSDGLTGIANRRCFDQRLLTEWEVHRHARQSLALLLMDVDCFKALNDACGHLHGDDCLRALAKLCDEALLDSQTLVARYGGEEFVLLLPRCDLPTACRHAEALRRRVEVMAIPHPASPVALHLTISIGVSATCPDADHAPQSLIMNADRALYLAKSRGRDQVVGL
jgi:diguanylate cyclase (GGDEF)-like protein